MLSIERESQRPGATWLRSGEAGTRGLRRVCLAGPTATRCSGDSLFSTRTRAERSILQPKAEWECLVLCQLWSEMDA